MGIDYITGCIPVSKTHQYPSDYCQGHVEESKKKHSEREQLF